MVIPIHEACFVSVCLGFVFVDRIVTLQKIRAALCLVVCKCIYVYIYMHIHIYVLWYKRSWLCFEILPFLFTKFLYVTFVIISLMAILFLQVDYHNRYYIIGLRFLLAFIIIISK